jgi:thymidine kinase
MLTVITGPMYAGKTSALISHAMAHVIAGKFVIAFKPANDTRYDKIDIISHSGHKFPAIPIDSEKPGKSLSIMFDFESIDNHHVDVVCFDEAQFFNKRNFEQVIEQLLYVENKILIVAGLSQDFEGRPFGGMPHCLAISDDIIHLKAVCSKSKELFAATRTYKKNVGNGDQVEVGGTELYEARSFKHWIKE